jgi:hypothetical protein
LTYCKKVYLSPWVCTIKLFDWIVSKSIYLPKDDRSAAIKYKFYKHVTRTLRGIYTEAKCIASW